MAIILFMGAVSGAHLNPAVSLAFAMRGDFPWYRVPGYIIVQLVGATLAALFLFAVFGDVGHLGATLPGPGYANWQALLMEVALTAGLVSVILGTASAAQNVGAIAAFASFRKPPIGSRKNPEFHGILRPCLREFPSAECGANCGPVRQPHPVNPIRASAAHRVRAAARWQARRRSGIARSQP